MLLVSEWSKRDTIKFNQCKYVWEASEASEILSGMYKFKLVRYTMYICVCGGTCAIIVAHATHT